MARDTGPQCKQCRREGQKLFLKGERCLTDKCGVERRGYPPGEHGRGRQKQSEYRLQPCGDLPGQLGRVPDHLRRGRLGANGDHVVVAHLITRDVHAAAVDGPVPVQDELAGLAA